MRETLTAYASGKIVLSFVWAHGMGLALELAKYTTLKITNGRIYRYLMMELALQDSV